MSGKGGKTEAEYKAIASISEETSERAKNGRILCYVCGGNGANWSLYCKENDAEKSPYFPFLQSIDKAEGAQAMRSNGRIDACTLCFSFLVQQWRSYEENDTPISKRTYWLKRSGGVNNDTLDLKEDKFGNDESFCLPGESHGTIVESNINLESVNDDKSLESNCPDLSGLDENKHEIVNKESPEEEKKMLEKKSRDPQSPQKEVKDAEPRELCCSCGGSTHLKTVNTKPQLKTETPFYPFLAQRSHHVDFMGKVRVCKSCKVHLCRQWDKYETLHTPLSERYYTLPAAYDARKEVNSDRFVCFLCGEKHASKSAKDIQATNDNPEMPYFPFLLRRLPPAGASDSAEAGGYKVCKSCHESLINQWTAFEDAGLAIHERKYKVDKKHAPRNKNDISSNLLATTYMCSVCMKLKTRSQIDCNYVKEENITVSDDVDHPERNAVCLDCKKTFQQCPETSNNFSHARAIEPSHNPHKATTPARMPVKNDISLVSPGVAANRKRNESLHFETCFLCGEQVNALNLEYLYVFPRQYVNGFRPFFPSLAYRVPAYHAKPPSSSGTVITCACCHGNMINQWSECEKHEQHGISNPWVRQYTFSQFTCYLCSKIFPRQKITTVSSSDFLFLTKVRRPVRGFRINNQKDYVVCQHCKEIIHVQKENFDKCRVDVSERDYELPMVQLDAKPLKRKASESQSESNHPVVVIGDSEPEGDDAEVWKREEKTSASNVVTSSRASASTGSSVTKGSSVPMSSPSSAGQNSSFAAALRKLAKQAMSPGSQSPISVLPPQNSSTMSPVKSNGCESPKLNGTPTVCKKEVPDPSYLSSKENRVHPNLPSSSELSGLSGHQVVPGVFSLGHRGYEGKAGAIEELHGAGRVQDIQRVRAVHPPHPPHPSHPFYMPFLQRPTVPESMYLPPFPPYYPPTMMEPGMLPPGFDHEAWRKRRALEHMRQQHERHAQFFPPSHDRPLYIMEQDHLKPLSVQASMSQRPYPGDLPPRGEKNLGKSSPRLEPSPLSDPRTTASAAAKETVKTPEALGSKSPRGEPHPVSSSLIRQAGISATPVIMSTPHSPGSHQTSLRSPSREAAPHSGEREAENMKDGKQREHQVMWTRRMFEQKRRLRQEEMEWQHRQQQVRQQKREVQQELFQFRQKLLQQKELEKDDNCKKDDERTELTDDSLEGMKERSKDGQRVSPESRIGLPQYAYPPLYHDTPQPLQMSNMFAPSRLPHHEMFYPPGYLPQTSLPPRMDTRMYKEYLQQPTQFIHDNKAVSEWLEKQRHPENLLADGKERFVNGEAPKDRHEPQKLKFMKDLGLMSTVSDKREWPQAMFVGGKRKFPEDTTQDESNKENRVENGDVNTETKKANVEEDTEKVDFLFHLGLVTHRKRQELEDDFEKNRWERRHQRLQRKTKKSKKEKKEEKSRSRTPLDLDVSGPMTRQKQQLLQEYGLLLPIKDAMEKESSSSPDSAATADRDSEKSKDSPGGSQAKKSKKSDSPAKDETFRNTYEISTPPPRPTTSTPHSSGPQLTLQSLTHMENPYRAFSSAFHPPFYHSGLLSVHQEPTRKDPRMATESSAPSRTGSKSYPAIVPGNIGVYRGSGAETRPSWMLTEEPLRWPGASKVIQSYLAYHKEQENELNISKEREEKLRIQNSSLSGEYERLNCTYSELRISKQQLQTNQEILNGKLDRLRNFMVLVQKR